jgi:hypothetical protein
MICIEAFMAEAPSRLAKVCRICTHLSIPWVRCECRSRARGIKVAPIMATATTAAPSGNLGTTLPRAASHSGGFTSHSSTKKLSATTAMNPR